MRKADEMTTLTMEGIAGTSSPKLVDPRVVRAQAGDLEAFNDLVREYERLIYSVCYRVLGRRESAEDAAQESFIAAWRHIGSVSPDSFKPWLYRIALNTSKSHIRKLRRQAETTLDEAGEIEDSDPTPEVMASRHELRDEVAAALDELSAEQREVIVLWHQAGLDYQEIARVTGTSIGTVKSRLFRGRRNLAARIGARLADPA